MARRRRPEAGTPVPTWLLSEQGDRSEEAVAYCRAHGISPLTLARYRAWFKAPDSIRLRRSERAEIATWVIIEEEP